MKYFKKTLAIVLALVLMSATVAACGKNVESAGKDDEPTATVTPDASQGSQEVAVDKVIGVVNGTTYTNEFFKFTAELPADWAVASREELLEINQLESGFIKTSAESSEEVVDVAAQPIIPLFMISQLGFDTTQSSANLSVQAFNMGSVSNPVQSLKDYLNLIVEAFNASGFEMTTKEIVELQISGHTFAKAETVLKVGEYEVPQTMYATMAGEHIIHFTLSATDDGTKQIMENVVNSVKFQ